jgi:hypothetical protein
MLILINNDKKIEKEKKKKLSQVQLTTIFLNYRIFLKILIMLLGAAEVNQCWSILTTIM